MLISAVILTKNEEKLISQSIKSINFCDEVILIDDSSTDSTKLIAEKLGVKIFQRKLNGDFSKQRNFGIDKASGDWIIFIDADEIISDDLIKEIKTLVATGSDLSSFRLRRRDYFWNHEMRFGETADARNKGIVRLVRKGEKRWFGNVHEKYIPDDRIGQLNGYINHYPHQSINDFIESVNFYSTLRAKELYKHEKKTNVFQLFFYPLGKFIYNYFLKLGFLDGSAGFVYSFMMSFHSFLVRAKLLQYMLYD